MEQNRDRTDNKNHRVSVSNPKKILLIASFIAFIALCIAFVVNAMLFSRLADISGKQKELENKFASSTSATGIKEIDASEALALMQDQYNAYQSQLTMLLTVMSIVVAVFAIAAPIYSQSVNEKRMENMESRFEKLEAKTNENELARNEESLKAAEIQLEGNDADVEPFKPIGERNRDYAHAHYMNSRRYYIRKRFELALKEANKAVDLDSKNAKYNYNLGDILLQMNRCDDALKAMKNAVDLEPGKALFHHGLGAVLLAMKHYGKALEELTEAVSIEPYNIKYGISKLISKYYLQQYDGIIPELNKLIKKCTNKRWIANAYSCLGLTAIQLELRKKESLNFDSAIANLNTAISLAEDPSEFYCNRAEGYLLLHGILDEADAQIESDLKEAERLNASEPDIYHLYAQLYEKRGGDDNLNKAQEYHAKAKELGYIEEPNDHAIGGNLQRN